MTTSSSPPPKSPEIERPLSFLGAAGWTIGATLIAQLIVAITESARPGAVTDLVSLTMCHVLAYSIVIFAMLRVYAPRASIRGVLGMRSIVLGAPFLAAAIGAGISPALSALDDLVAKRFPSTPEEIEALEKLMTAGTASRRALVVASLVFIFPMIEELFFRGLLFGGLRRARTPGLAILASAVFFASGPADVRAFVSLFALGLVLAWIRASTGSVWASMAAHMAFFAVPIAPVIWKGDAAGDVVFPRSWIAGGILIALLAAGTLARLTARSDDARLAREADA